MISGPDDAVRWALQCVPGARRNGAAWTLYIVPCCHLAFEAAMTTALTSVRGIEFEWTGCGAEKRGLRVRMVQAEEPAGSRYHTGRLTAR